MPKVADIMDRKVVSVPSSATITHAARQMRGCRNGIIPVCDDGKFRGVITERDIVTGIVAMARNPSIEPVSLLLKSNFPVISPDDDIWHAANVMVDSGAWILPVVENGNLHGLFTLMDFARESPALAAMVFTRTARLQLSRETAV